MKTLGEQRVRTEFNPSKEDSVSIIKQKSAELINIINDIDVVDGESARLKALALTSIEEGAMWGVKLATINK